MKIAVVGMSARLPGARNAAELWRNLAGGHDAVGEVPLERWDHRPWYDPDPAARNKTNSRWGGFIDGVDEFDPLFFNISPLEAEWMDPQHRLFLEEAYKAIEDAGYAGVEGEERRWSVFVGCKEADYISRLRGLELGAYGSSGSSMAILPARLSYFLNLKGPSIPVNTACSSALVAVHLACESLRSGACDTAIAGGISLTLSPRTHVVLGKAGLLSPAGRCRTFADAADGIAIGEGVGVVVLKPLERALADGDHIHGVILASGINQDGKTNGITAPSGPSQTALELGVYERAGISPESLGYVEAHGTGTRLGDPIEVHALGDAFARYTTRRQFCALGAAKTNVGHTLEASGMVGLIKVLSSLRERTLVPSLHFDRPNRHIDFASTPFFVNTETRHWPEGAEPRRAALSAFGFSGTNAHLVLEEAPPPAPRAAHRRGAHLMVLSARSESALRQRALDLEAWLGAAGASASLADVELSLLSRAHHGHRAALRVDGVEELRQALAGLARGEAGERVLLGTAPSAGAHGGLRDIGNELLRGRGGAASSNGEEQRRAAVLAALYVKGYELSWPQAAARDARRIPLPTYPFARERHWVAASEWDELAGKAQVAVPDAVARPPEAGDVHAELRRTISELLRLPDGALGPDDALVDFGFDSLIGLQLSRRLEERYGVRWNPAELLELGSVRRLAERLASDAVSAPAPALALAIVEQPQQAEFPLSAGQLGLWLAEQLAPDSTAYHVPCVFRLGPSVDRARLQRALVRLWQRHPSLRARIAVGPDGPRQIVEPSPAGATLVEHTLESAAEPERPLIERLVREPFDLARGPLARVHLVQRPGQAPLLVLSAHHLVLDGSSVRIWARDLAALYDAEPDAASSSPASPPPASAALQAPAASYADFVAWQKAWLDGEAGARLRAHWRERLTPLPEPAGLLGDRPRGPRRSTRRSTHRSSLSAQVAADVVRFSSAHQVYPSAVYLAAFEALLHRHSGAEDLALAVPVANRPHAKLEGVIGHFVNIVCMRSQVRASASFLELVRELQAAQSEALEHAALPFTELVSELGGSHDRGQVPFVQAQFVYQNWVGPAAARRGAPAEGGLELEPLLEWQQEGEFELSLELIELGGTFQVFIKYAPDLYDAETIERFAEHYRELLAAGLREPQRELGQLQFLTPVERYQLEREWRRTERPFTRHRCVHELFEAVVERAPDDVAVIDGKSELSYRELNARANQLALRLRADGVTPDSIVAVVAERSLEMMVALFGVLKAGGAYLPIDPRYPAERIRYMLDDSHAKVVLVSDRALAPASWNGPVLEVAGSAADAAGPGNPERVATPAHLAYVIYTSGSTGRPKGAMIEHRALVNRLEWMQNLYPIGRGDVILQKTPFTFDVSVWELFWWSIAGARLALLAPGAEKDPAAVARAVHEHRVSVMHFVPSALSVFLEYVAAEARRARELRSLRQVFASGEALGTAQVKRFDELLHAGNGTRLANLYGPTEATIDVSYFDCSEQRDHERIPIGRPIQNIELLVLGPEQQLQPVGVPGELCIAGVGVARGYLNNPELTAARFVDHPLVPGARMYRTGDLARWLPDGNVEYLGRLDRQIKLRGQRIELGEIESVLASAPGVRDAFVSVVPSEGAGHEPALVAYWVAARGAAPSAEGLRQRLAERLPDAMVPSAFVRLEALPQTAHGKVDVRALPRPVLERSRRPTDLEAPRPGLEQQIADILRELTGRARVGRGENFFELGCHSLTLARAAIRLSAVLGREVPVVKMFEHPTVAALALQLAPKVRPTALDGSVSRGQRQRQILGLLARVDRTSAGALNGSNPGDGATR